MAQGFQGLDVARPILGPSDAPGNAQKKQEQLEIGPRIVIIYGK